MKHILALLCALLLPMPAYAQTGIIVVGARPKADVVSSFGAKQSYLSGYENNRSTLQAQLDATPQQYPWFFPGGYATRKPIIVDDSLVVPRSSGRKWEGVGYGNPLGTSSAADWGSFIMLRAVSSATTFDGATNKLTSSGAGTTVVVTGRAVTSRDQFNSVEITAGTNATPGWYGIVSVSEGASGVGTWTLDRNWCTDAVTDGEAYYCPAIVTNLSQGMIHEGLSFVTRGAGDTSTAQVLYHICTTEQAGINFPTGKHVFRDCGFEYSQVGILCGADMAGAYDSADDWTGRDANHADHLTVDHSWFANVNTPIYVRNEQSLQIDVRNLRASGLDGEVFRFDAGGKLTATGIFPSGGSGVQRALHLGPWASYNQSPYVINLLNYDHSTNAPEFIETAWTGLNKNATVIIRDAYLDALGAQTGLLVDVQSRLFFRLENICASHQFVTGIWPESILMKQGASASFVPHGVISGSVLDVTTDCYEVINSSSDAGTVEFVGNCKPDGTRLENGYYTVGVGWTSTD